MAKTLSDWLEFIERQHPNCIDMGLDRVRDVASRMGLQRPAKRVIAVQSTGMPRKLARGLEHLAELALMQLKEVLDVFATRSVAKAKASSVARLAAQEAVQMHGGIGMTDAIDIGLFMKRMQVASALYGDADFHADRVATARGF